MKYLYYILAICILAGCSSSSGEEEGGGRDAFVVRILDGNGSPVTENVRLDVYTVREDFNSLVPYADYDVTSGTAEITVYRPTRLIVTAVAYSYNPVRMIVDNAVAGQSVDIVLEPRSGLRIMEYNVDYGWGSCRSRLGERVCKTQGQLCAVGEEI